jgi:small neutral amino acid transporter SnatA (MarC family)
MMPIASVSRQMSHLVIACCSWGGTFIILLQSSLFLRLLGEN